MSRWASCQHGQGMDQWQHNKTSKLTEKTAMLTLVCFSCPSMRLQVEEYVQTARVGNKCRNTHIKVHWTRAALSLRGGKPGDFSRAYAQRHMIIKLGGVLSNMWLQRSVPIISIFS